MRYCVDYDTHKKRKYDNADEIIFPYSGEKILVDLLTSEEFANKRLIVHTDDLTIDIVKYMIAIKKEHNDLDLTVRYSKCNDTSVLAELTTEGIKYFMLYYVNNWDMYYEQIDLGVSDVYIVESLGFELDCVRDIADKHNLIVRAFPNVAQGEYKELNALYKFFLRPDDIEYIEDYIDVLEFYGLRENQLTYLDIYKKEKWFGRLDEIITDLNSDIDGRFLLPEYALYRSTCGRKCLKGKPCNLCERVELLSKTLEKNQIMITKDTEVDNNKKI